MKQIKSVMLCDFKKSMRTMRVIDQFENGDTAHGRFFDTLYLKDLYRLRKEDFIFKIGLLIQDLDYKEKEIERYLTFTSLKNDYGGTEWFEDSTRDVLQHELFVGLKTVMDLFNDPDVPDFIYDHHFQAPIKLTAQSTWDRSFEQVGTALSDYAIVGARYEIDVYFDW